ncbi:hypothetical protein SISNIDRAFT_458965 [Sistotremastrum niveocremeum HHB9708]|uniref:Low temperature requirement A n=2 Tax=Sistotremastraceae TaxID=3402574 RepID=A0A164Q1G2_9AGAM|nr:hypothetical protein SISNIDRAFT_458965 [Sistotremastrum niveocremeum HHB9708]KZT35836.1 hypothetical protein SISSUDRAFT_1050767 [Sistotremastrum suecicum HHB10207 ss-3]
MVREIRRRVLGTFIKSADPKDLALRRERESGSIPFTKSPFQHGRGVHLLGPLDEEKKAELEDQEEEGELTVAEEVPWIDLVLEIAMTTAFTNLTDNTPIVTAQNATSYLCFFALVWWIWASQVAYNIRFRQSDWLHRGFAFLNLALFGALAAFTNNFDITTGLTPAFNPELFDSVAALGTTDGATIQAQMYRDALIPILNAKGISVCMALSRVVLLLQYLLVLLYSRPAHRPGIMVHLSSLIASILCYTTAFLLLLEESTSSTRPRNIAKLVLWFLPLLLECILHFKANNKIGRVRYSAEAMYNRSSVLFIIILGAGLDRITNKFQYIVGYVGFGPQSVGVIISAGVIIVGIFSLYFGSESNTFRGDRGDHGVLFWFFMHFPFMATLILMLQASALLVAWVNLQQAITVVLDFTQDILNATGSLSVDQFPQANATFATLGMSLAEFVKQMNNASSPSDPDAETMSKLKQVVNIVKTVFEQSNALPDPDSLLAAQLQGFGEGTLATQDSFVNLMNDLMKSRLDSALWFPGVAGGTLITLSILNVSKQWPRDRYEWGIILSRMLGGLGFSFLTIMDAGSGRSLLETDDQPIAAMWRFALTPWILPSFALLLIVQNLIEMSLRFFARRSYRASDRLNSSR